MSTTNLFVELVVIGVGAVMWLSVAFLGIFGLAWFPLEQLNSPLFLIVFFSVVYILGIITDRMADSLFEKWYSGKLREEWFPSIQAYYSARRIVFERSQHLSNILEYRRSRLRICRGWIVNFVFLTITANLYIWVQLSPSCNRITISFFVTSTLVLLVFLSWLSWKRLVIDEYKKSWEQADALSKTESMQKQSST